MKIIIKREIDVPTSVYCNGCNQRKDARCEAFGQEIIYNDDGQKILYVKCHDCWEETFRMAEYQARKGGGKR